MWFLPNALRSRLELRLMEGVGYSHARCDPDQRIAPLEERSKRSRGVGAHCATAFSDQSCLMRLCEQACIGLR